MKQKNKKQYISQGQSIQKKFEQNLFKLPFDKQFHFALRMYRITGHRVYWQILDAYARLLEYKLKNITPNLHKNDFIKEKAQEIYQNYEIKNKRRKLRKKFYKDKPEILFYDSLLFNAFNFKSLGLDSILPNEFQVILDFFSQPKRQKCFLDKDLIKTDPIKSLTKIYYLHYLNLVDLRDELKDNFLLVQHDPDWLYINKMFALTHFIIVDSYFYQRFVDPQKHQWILNYFKNHFEKIKQKTNIGLIIEVGLCFQLCQKKEEAIFKQITSLLEKKFNKQLGYLPRFQKDNLKKSEHSNIIALMYLRNPQKLYPGPNLKNFHKE